MICIVYPSVGILEVNKKVLDLRSAKSININKVKLNSDIGFIVLLPYSAEVVTEVDAEDLDYTLIMPDSIDQEAYLFSLNCKLINLERKIDALAETLAEIIEPLMIYNNDEYKALYEEYSALLAYWERINDKYQSIKTAMPKNKNNWTINKKLVSVSEIEQQLINFGAYNVSTYEKFIWGKSFETDKPNLYTNNWIQIVYNKELKKYFIDINNISEELPFLPNL